MYRLALSTLGRSPLLTRHAFGRLQHRILVRTVASSVSGRPGSQSLPHAAENVKEELGNSVRDLAETLGGGALKVGKMASQSEGFLGITSKVASTVPTPVMVFGLAGGLPYLGTAATSFYLARQAGLSAAGLLPNIDPAVMLAAMNNCLEIQATYGAVMLSFLGALHWGMEFAGYGGYHGAQRLALGAAPVAFAWPTLMLDPATALIAQWLGFTAMWAADMRATNMGWAPSWYAQYRFYLTLLVGTCIIGTLAGTNFFGPVAGRSWTTHDLRTLRDERRRLHAENIGELGGEIEAIPGESEDSDAFVIIRELKSEDEEGEKEEKEEK